jgi:acetyl-CoA acyltransferase
MAGAYDVSVVVGVEAMTRVPMGITVENQLEQDPFSPSIVDRYAPVGGLVSQGIGAEIIADRWGLTREQLDAFAVRSHTRAAEAVAEGHFDNEIASVPVQTPEGSVEFTVDEGIRPGSTPEILATLKPAFKPDGKITAGTSSQISDGAAAVLIMSEEKAQQLGLRPRARFQAFAIAGADPVSMLTGPIPASRKALDRGGLTIDEIDAFEVNEAFASVVLAWAAELEPDMECVNPNGGAIALGHPLGCSGAKLTATLLNQLERTDGRYGLLTMCEGGGMANATIIERL